MNPIWALLSLGNLLKPLLRTLLNLTSSSLKKRVCNDNWSYLTGEWDLGMFLIERYKLGFKDVRIFFEEREDSKPD